MESYRRVSAILLFLFTILANSAFESDGVFESRGFRYGRSLLQATRNCQVDFENANYTILTSQCKQPDYPAEPCCAAFTQFICPDVADIYDDTKNCAETMFSYIYLHGYPVGLFKRCENIATANCSATAPASKSAQPNGAQTAKVLSPLIETLLFTLLLLFSSFKIF